MAGCALVEANFKRVHIMAIDAGVVARDVVEFGVVTLALIFIPTLCYRAIQGGCGSVVVDI